MMRAFRRKVRVQPGGRIEIREAGLPSGAEAEVIVVMDEIRVAGETAGNGEARKKRTALARLRRVAGKMKNGEKPFGLREMTAWIREERERR